MAGIRYWTAQRIAWPERKTGPYVRYAEQHARSAWTAATRATLMAVEQTWLNCGQPNVSRSGASLGPFFAEIDLTMVGRISEHVSDCTACHRRYADGERPVDLIRAALARSPMADIWRAGELEAREARRRRSRWAIAAERARTRHANRASESMLALTDVMVNAPGETLSTKRGSVA